MTPAKADTHVVSEGYISKADAALKFNRHSVTLSDDIIRALNNKDHEVLKLLKLVTKDKKERRATTLTVAKVKALKKEGMQPRWFLHPDDVVPLFIKRRSKDPSPKQATPIKKSTIKTKGGATASSESASSEQVSGNNAVEVAVLRSKNELLLEINADLKADKTQLREDNKQLRGVLKRQAKAIQETGGALLIEKQINRDLRLQMEAADTASSDDHVPNRQPTILVSSDDSGKRTTDIKASEKHASASTSGPTLHASPTQHREADAPEEQDGASYNSRPATFWDIHAPTFSAWLMKDRQRLSISFRTKR